MKYLKLFALTLLIALSSGGVAHAQDVRPLKENDQIIQSQSQEVQQKAVILQNTSQEIQSLEQKKQSLLEQLQTEQSTVADLKQKIADKKAAADAEAKRLAEVKNMFVHVARYADNAAGNMYDPGQCTWYVKNRRPDLPNNLGNANTWYYNAAAYGYDVGSAPKKGAVGTTTRGYAGHVVYVEGVSLDGQSITISEMNYAGPYSLRTRQADASEFTYIYELN